MLFYSWFVSFRPTKDHTLHSIFVNMSLKSLLMYRLPFVSFYLSFLLNLDHWSCRIFHILDFSDCIPVVLINSISLISYKLVVISRNLISFRFDFCLFFLWWCLSWLSVSLEWNEKYRVVVVIPANNRTLRPCCQLG